MRGATRDAGAMGHYYVVVVAAGPFFSIQVTTFFSLFFHFFNFFRFFQLFSYFPTTAESSFSIFSVFSLPGAFIDHPRALLLLNYGISLSWEKKSSWIDYRNSVLRGKGRARLGLDYDDYGEVIADKDSTTTTTETRVENYKKKLQNYKIFTTVQNPRNRVLHYFLDTVLHAEEDYNH